MNGRPRWHGLISSSFKKVNQMICIMPGEVRDLFTSQQRPSSLVFSCFFGHSFSICFHSVPFFLPLGIYVVRFTNSHSLEFLPSSVSTGSSSDTHQYYQRYESATSPLKQKFSDLPVSLLHGGLRRGSSLLLDHTRIEIYHWFKIILKRGSGLCLRHKKSLQCSGQKELDWQKILSKD